MIALYFDNDSGKLYRVSKKENEWCINTAIIAENKMYLHPEGKMTADIPAKNALHEFLEKKKIKKDYKDF